MAGGGIDFTFDPAPFLAGVRKASDGMSGLLGRAGDVEKKIAGGINKAVMGVASKVGLLFAAFKSVGAVLKEMPEVGQAFGIAKDVFLKNLLWPLRQQVMPMLQGMLDWTRDNRVQFARWGVAVANVFRTVTVVASALWDVFKELVKAVGDSFQRAFQTNFKSFDEFLNVLSFKVSAVIVYMGMLAKDLVADLKPAFDWVMDAGATVVDFFARLVTSWGTANEQGKSLGTVMDKIGQAVGTIATAVLAAARGFSDGFLPAVRNAMTPLDSIFDTFNRLLGVLGLNDTQGVRGAFKGLGAVLGTALTGTLTVVAALFDGLVTTLGTLGKLAGVVGAIFQGDWGKVSSEWKSIGPIWDEWTKRQDELWKGMGVGTGSTSVQDAIITKDGKVIRTDPQDNLYAFKSLGAARGPGGALTVTNYVTVSVTEGDAERAGYEFMSGLGRGGSALADALAQARMAEGY